MHGIAAHKRGESAVDPLSGQPLPPPRNASAAALTAHPGRELSHFWMSELLQLLGRGGDAHAYAILVRSRATYLALYLLFLGGSATGALLVSPFTYPRVLVALLVCCSAGMLLTLFGALKLRAAAVLRRDPPTRDELIHFVQVVSIAWG